MNVRILLFLFLWLGSAHDLFDHGILLSHTVRGSANDATLDHLLGGVLHAFRGKTSAHNQAAYLRFLRGFAVLAAALKLASVGAPGAPLGRIFSLLPAAILRRLAWMLA